MKRQELMANMEEKDLIALKDLGEKVHIVWSDSKSYKRICRPSMIEVALTVGIRENGKIWENVQILKIM